jgi:A/G-specific adenine glycosylase
VSSPIAKALLAWYAAHRRELPWRDHPDPYAVWVSEVMLQQTRAETVNPYFERWMVRFPTIANLAAADQQAVLEAWEGLGYYGRARNLHRAARLVAEKHGGELPREVEGLRALPGIGRYTAGAIASLAFGADQPAVDGNVRRVLARLFDLRQPLDRGPGARKAWELAAEHLPKGQAGDYNQALMDLGATICAPRHPDCEHCPLNAHCQAYALGLQDQRPVTRPKAELPHRTAVAAVIRQNGHVLLRQRPQDGLLGGMWAFPGGHLPDEGALSDTLHALLKEDLDLAVQVGEQLALYRHAYTHFRVTLHAFDCSLNGTPELPESETVRWVALGQLADYPMGKLDRQIARLLQGENGTEAGE